MSRDAMRAFLFFVVALAISYCCFVSIEDDFMHGTVHYIRFPSYFAFLRDVRYARYLLMGAGNLRAPA